MLERAHGLNSGLRNHEPSTPAIELLPFISEQQRKKASGREEEERTLHANKK